MEHCEIRWSTPGVRADRRAGSPAPVRLLTHGRARRVHLMRHAVSAWTAAAAARPHYLLLRLRHQGGIRDAAARYRQTKKYREAIRGGSRRGDLPRLNEGRFQEG